MVILILLIIAVFELCKGWLSGDGARFGRKSDKDNWVSDGWFGGNSGQNPTSKFFRSKFGGVDDARESSVRGEIEKKTSKAMESFIQAQAARMDDDLRKVYVALFEEQVAAKNQAPVVTLDDIPHELPYSSDAHIFRTSTHIGQRKLFDSELQFFTNYIRPDEEATCIYAGAAPSNHTGFLSQLFPNIKFILIDPNKFDIFGARPHIFDHTRMSAQLMIDDAYDGREKIYIINDLMTMDIAHAVAQHTGRTFFISDIRTNLADGMREPDVTDILWNLSQQYNWISVMKPAQSMLKFRHPFYIEDPAIFARKSKESPYAEDFAMSKEFGIDFAVGREAKSLTYFAGTVYLQTYPGQSSTETRLVTDGKALQNYGGPETYENKLFYYNSIRRCYGHHKNPNADKKLGFDHCNDCALENLLWSNYIEKYNVAAKAYAKANGHTAPRVKLFVEALSKNTKRPLIREHHGTFFGAIPYAEYTPLVKEFQQRKARAFGH